MRITSPAFLENQKIPSMYTCDGENINPPLIFSDIPEDAKSLALILDDPDAPMGTFLHWMIWNIDPRTKEITENSFPNESFQGLNGAGKAGYIGACPPSGVHHYHFKLFALNKMLDVSPNISKEELESQINDSLLEKAELIGLYSRVSNP